MHIPIGIYFLNSMHSHSRSVFNNSCLQVPRNRKIDQPLPLYDQTCKFQLENEKKKLDMTLNEIGKKKFVDKEGSQSFLNFISDIPEYDDINHLTNKEFYKKLENLKERKKFFEDYLQLDIRFDGIDSEWIKEYRKQKLAAKKNKDTKNRAIKPFCTTPNLNKISRDIKTPDVGIEIMSDKEIMNKPPSRRSVRIETPSDNLFSSLTPEPRCKSRAKSSVNEDKCVEWDDLSIERLNLDTVRTPIIMETRSAPCSPTRSKFKNEGGITIPKPFQMTVR